VGVVAASQPAGIAALARGSRSQREAERILQRIEYEAAPSGNLRPAVVYQPVPPRRVPISVLFTRPVVRRTTYGIGGVVGTIAGMYLTLVVIIAFAGIETNQRSLESLAPGAGPLPATVATAIRDEAAL
jgi:hypothetical protein